MVAGILVAGSVFSIGLAAVLHKHEVVPEWVIDVMLALLLFFMLAHVLSGVVEIPRRKDGPEV